MKTFIARRDVVARHVRLAQAVSSRAIDPAGGIGSSDVELIDVGASQDECRLEDAGADDAVVVRNCRQGGSGLRATGVRESRRTGTRLVRAGARLAEAAGIYAT